MCRAASEVPAAPPIQIDFARLTLDYPLTVRFIEYMPCGDWAENRHLIVSGTVVQNRIQEELGELIPLKIQAGDGPAHYFRLKGTKGLLGFILPVSNPFCSQCNRLRLTPDGHLKSCLLSEEGLYIKPLINTDKNKLVDAIRRAILTKPESHSHSRETQMSRIGG